VIHVSKLTKYYGDYAAIRDVSFDVAKGQIVGFLGPNGAGKTTTMRILAGYLTATSGRATIDGLDVFWRPVEVRRRIGYLPENCPLYTEMRVNEYLRFRAGLKGAHGKKQRQRVDEVVDRCWLTDVRRQLIGTLSKGYRQRVGLADSLLAEPAVLVLDEPTAGLDPTQSREPRKLIRDRGGEHTILLSTHILPEVEMTCNHVIINHRGQVAASSSLDELTKEAREKTVVIVESEEPIDTQAILDTGGISRMENIAVPTGTRLRITQEGSQDRTAKLCKLAVENRWRVVEIRPQRQTLEDLFVRITGQEEAAEEAVAAS